MKYNKHLLCVDSFFNKKVRWLYILSLLFAVSFFYSQSNLKVQAADGDIAINADNFPDNNFRDYLRSRTYGADGQLTVTEIGDVSRIDVSSKEISSLKGIEYFTELTNLSCSGNNLTNLDISKNTKLTELHCFNNKLTSLNISYQLNGGINHKDNLVSLKATDSLTLKSPTRTGYTFAGWYSDASFKTEVTSLLGENVISTTLYAKWTPSQYTVTFDAQKGTVSPKTKKVVYDAQYGSLPTPERTGYSFQGWYTQSSGGSKITDSKIVTITKEQTLYARWEAKQYTLKFNAGKGTVSQKTKKITYDAQYGSLPTPKRTGYSFRGWYTKSSGGSKITDSKIVTITKEQTLYARWEAKQYTLKFNAGEGKVSQKTKKITYDAKYGSLPNPKRAGYSFQGWYTKSSGGSKITSSKKVTVTKGQTLHARWKKVSVAKVSIRSIKNSSPKKAVLSLKKVSGASGYQVVYADNKNFKKAKKTDVSGTKVTLKKLTKGKTWHVKVRAYKKDSAGKKVYGKYSSVKKIKIKK